MGGNMNEPVAWTSQDVLDADHIIKAVMRREQDEQHTIPLYTHPAKTLTDDSLVNFKPIWQEKPKLTLTDKEIEGIARANVDGHSSMEQLKWFARAILKKAQEK